MIRTTSSLLVAVAILVSCGCRASETRAVEETAPSEASSHPDTTNPGAPDQIEPEALPKDYNREEQDKPTEPGAASGQRIDGAIEVTIELPPFNMVICTKEGGHVIRGGSPATKDSGK